MREIKRKNFSDNQGNNKTPNFERIHAEERLKQAIDRKGRADKRSEQKEKLLAATSEALEVLQQAEASKKRNAKDANLGDSSKKRAKRKNTRYQSDLSKGKQAEVRDDEKSAILEQLYTNIRSRRDISDEDIPQVTQIIHSIRQDSSPRNALLFLWALHNSTDVSKNGEAWNKLLIKESINYLQEGKTFTDTQIAVLKKQVQDDNIFGEYAAKHLDDGLKPSNNPRESQQQDSMSFSEASNRYLDLTKLRLTRPITRDQLPETVDVKSLTTAIVNDNSLRVLITSPVNFECAVTEAKNYLSAGGAVSINLNTIQTKVDRIQIRKYFETERKARKVKFVDFNTSDPKQFLQIIQQDNIGYDAITTRPRAAMEKELIQAAVDNTLIHPLRFVGCSCVGFDHIDIKSYQVASRGRILA